MSTLADLQKRNIAQMEVAAASEHNSSAEPEPTPNLDTDNYTTILQGDKPTDLPTNNATDQQTVRQTSRQTDKLANKPTNKQTSKRAVRPAPVPEPPARPTRVDGRTLRPRQETADQTMVTSMRLAVSTLEMLDDYCYQHRQRKQDVVQAALDLYFAAEDAEGEE